MRINLFPGASLEELHADPEMASDRLESLLSESLSARALAFTLLWTKNLTVLISGLHVRSADANASWTPVLTQQWMLDGGKFSHSLGFFEPGSTVEVMIVAMAMDADVPAAVGAVSGQAGTAVKQIIPERPAVSERMERGTPWIRSGRYTV